MTVIINSSILINKELPCTSNSLWSKLKKILSIHQCPKVTVSCNLNLSDGSIISSSVSCTGYPTLEEYEKMKSEVTAIAYSTFHRVNPQV